MAEQKPKDRLSACRSIPRVCPSTTSIYSRQSHLSPSTLSLFPAILLLLLSLFSKLRQKRRPSRKTTSQPGTHEFPHLYIYIPTHLAPLAPNCLRSVSTYARTTHTHATVGQLSCFHPSCLLSGGRLANQSIRSVLKFQHTLFFFSLGLKKKKKKIKNLIYFLREKFLQIRYIEYHFRTL